MKPELLSLLKELEAFGITNDDTAESRAQKMLNITHDTGNFLSLMIKATAAQNILEIGTSNGYSTLWLADAVGAQGSVTTIEQADHKIKMAEQNFEKSGFKHRIRQIQDDAGHFLNTCSPEEYDFIFLDSERYEYVGWWDSLVKVLKPNKLMIVDNATSHEHELKDFVELVSNKEGYLNSLVPIGKGELVILKESLS